MPFRKQFSNTARNCRNLKITNMRKPAAVFAAAALCLSLSVTAVAASGILKGCFRNITNGYGAVVGTSYERATDEISMSVTVNGNELNVLASFSVPHKFPYRETERLGIAAYQIVDGNGRIAKAGSVEAAEIVNGQSAISIRLDDIDCGSYRLVVTAFVSEKKADQPMNINGNWECAFSK